MSAGTFPACGTDGDLYSDLPRIVGVSPEIDAVVAMASRLAPTGLPVLLVGDTGVGKELVAARLHALSRRPGPLVPVDCGALPDELVEALLFGHRKGAFTGAVADAEGLIERADRGTLFLDELASLPPRGQVKLLRALETGEVRRVGSTRARRVDVRLVSSVQEDPAALVRTGAVRADLLQRLAGAVVRIPSLAERPGDVVPIARHYAAVHGRALARDAERLLAERAWPGNVRELRWTVERAALLCEGAVIDASVLGEALELGLDAGNGSGEDVPAWRAAHLRAACARHRGDPTKVAEALGVSRATLYRRLKEAGLELGAFQRTETPQ